MSLSCGSGITSNLKLINYTGIKRYLLLHCFSASTSELPKLILQSRWINFNFHPKCSKTRYSPTPTSICNFKNCSGVSITPNPHGMEEGASPLPGFLYSPLAPAARAGPLRGPGSTVTTHKPPIPYVPW